MMPSAQKQQVKTSGGATVTTTVTTTTAAAAPSANFTQAELGSRSLARSIDKKMNEMNQQKSASNNGVLDRVLAREAKTVSEDTTFGSTAVTTDIPWRIMQIINKHGIQATDIIRMIHLPGATYFSVSHMVDGAKKYTTFSVDEVVDVPEEEVEESELEEVEEVAEPESVVEETPDYPPTAIPNFGNTNTLGTIGVAPAPATTPVSETVPPNPVATIPEVLPTEPKIIIAPIEIVEPVKEIVSPVRAAFDNARLASAKEFSAYYSNHYKERQTGTFNQLFGNNQEVHDTLFKTINEYQLAKKDYLKEFSQSHPSIKLSIEEIRNEQLRLADMLSHQKHGTFAKVAHTFKLTIPTVIETRNRIIGTAGKSTLAPIAERLGIHGLTDNEPIWKKLFTNSNSEKNIPIIKVSPVSSSLVTTTNPSIVESQTEVAPVVLKKVNRKKLYDSLHGMISKAWNINQPKFVNAAPVAEPVSIVVQPVIQPEPQPVASVPVIEPAMQFVPEPVIETIPVAEPPAAVEQLVVTVPAPLSFSPDNKQHPEHLFN